MDKYMIIKDKFIRRLKDAQPEGISVKNEAGSLIVSFPDGVELINYRDIPPQLLTAENPGRKFYKAICERHEISNKLMEKYLHDMACGDYGNFFFSLVNKEEIEDEVTLPGPGCFCRRLDYVWADYYISPTPRMVEDKMEVIFKQAGLNTLRDACFLHPYGTPPVMKRIPVLTHWLLTKESDCLLERSRCILLKAAYSISCLYDKDFADVIEKSWGAFAFLPLSQTEALIAKWDGSRTTVFMEGLNEYLLESTFVKSEVIRYEKGIYTST